MTKTLKNFLEVYKPKSPDEQKFVDKHVVIKHKDRNGNGDDVFKATNIKTNKRKEERHGYDVGEDEKVYEELKGNQHKIDANKNGKVDAHDFHLLRKKKKVAEEVEEVEEARIYPDDYEVTSEKSQFGGHRPKVVHKEKGHTMYLGAHAYKKPAMAVKHGEAYLNAYAARGDNAAQNASMDFARANKKHLHIKEDVDIEAVLDEALDLLMSIDEKTLTPAEMKKREEVVKAIKRDDPKMDKSMAYAIATKTAKRVAEGTMPTADEPTDDNKKMAQKVRDLLAKEKKPVKEETEELDESAKVAAHLIKRYGDNVRKSHVRSAANDFGVGYVALSHAVRKKLGVNRLEEEQIDEISAETKDAYVKKAAPQLNKLFQKSGKDADSARKYYNRKNTVRKIANEEVEEIDEISKATMGRYINKAKDSIDMAAYRQGGVEARGSSSRPLEKKLTKRHKGISMAVNKLTKEEADSLEELSVAKLKDYRTKARADAYDADDVDDERRYRKRAAGSNTAGKKIVRQGGSLRAEEAEGLDELSKGKMLDYMDKASDARGHRNLSTKKVDNRYAGVKKASEKLTKEEVEAIDELSKKTLGSYVKKASGAEQPKNVMSPKNVPLTKIAAYQGDSETGHFGKRFNQHTYDKAERLRKNRETGIKTAVDKLTKEEVEAIDELSNKTLGKYAYKAASELGSRGITTGLKIAADEPTEKNFKKMGNRQKGVATAIKKLTKEDVINRAVEKYVPEELKFTPEERLLKRINGLSEAHINTILGLFEALNKDNQNKMIETVETREGINQILNFVLENRGK